MFKQLLHYRKDENGNPVDPVIVETSPNLSAEETIAWETHVSAKHAASLPEGRIWGIVPDTHSWFNDSLLPKDELSDLGIKGGQMLSPDQVTLLERTKQMRERFK